MTAMHQVPDTLSALANAIGPIGKGAAAVTKLADNKLLQPSVSAVGNLLKLMPGLSAWLNGGNNNNNNN